MHFGGTLQLPATPPDFKELLLDLSQEEMLRVYAASASGSVDRYLHWDEVRHRPPAAGLTAAQSWLALKLARLGQYRRLPLQDAAGRPFRYALPDRALELLRDVDQRASGRILLSEAVADPATGRRYLVDSLMEEAIASSQIEGASTTRRVAKEMLRTGRQPRDISERMIVNNYRAIIRIAEMKDLPLTPSGVLELHRILTEGTLDDPTSAGKLQVPSDERIRVIDPADNTILHVPPPATQLQERMEKLCRFANAEPSTPFVYPVIRAIVVHLWLAYDHPFEDGNGRTARALFYWVMASQGYSLAEYLAISRLLNRARARYRRSFLLTETDDLDATYFILHQLEVLVRAIGELHDHLRVKMRELRDTEGLLRNTGLNHRQLAVLGHALKHPDADYTYESHSRSHRVVRQSGRRDLLVLTEMGFLVRHRIGRTVHFRPARDLASRVSQGAGDLRTRPADAAGNGRAAP